MELIFDEKDIKEILIREAKAHGLEANHVVFGSYGNRATVMFDPDKGPKDAGLTSTDAS